jgi:hypothetical protein
MYRPVRYRSPAVVAEGIDQGLEVRRTIGLVGAEMACPYKLHQLKHLLMSCASGKKRPMRNSSPH